MRARGWLKSLKKDVEHTGGMKTTLAAVSCLILEGHTRQTSKLVKLESSIWCLHFKSSVCEVLVGTNNIVEPAL